MKRQFDKVDGFLGYSFASMALCTLLQLFSLCGLCRSKDKCFQARRLNYEDLPNDSAQDPNSSKNIEEALELASKSQIPPRASRYMIK